MYGQLFIKPHTLNTTLVFFVQCLDLCDFYGKESFVLKLKHLKSIMILNDLKTFFAHILK